MCAFFKNNKQMAITDKKYLGKIISRQLAEYLKRYTNTDDVLKAIESSEVGQYTLERVARGKKTLTKESAEALENLMRIAIQNAKDAKSMFNSFIKQAV